MTDTTSDNAVTDAMVAAARRADFAGWLAARLAEAAAELGSTEALLAGRPGSWEAALVRDLVGGTVGHSDEYLADHMRGTPAAEPEPGPGSTAI